jgi:hypothetical protein
MIPEERPYRAAEMELVNSSMLAPKAASTAICATADVSLPMARESWLSRWFR